MKRIAEVIDRALEWTQPSALKMHYELRADHEIAATLRFRSLVGSLATAESADGCWTFKRVGFFQTRVSVRACGEESEIAYFKPNTWKSGGTLELPDGKETLVTTNVWHTKLEFRTESGQTILQFKSGGLIHLSATVDVNPDVYGAGEPAWLMMLGWYLIIMMYMDSAAITAAIS
jgi:hypothetical protein